MVEITELKLTRDLSVKSTQGEILSGTGFVIRPAKPEDIGVILLLREKNSQWLKRIGSDQWAQPVTPRKLRKFAADIESGSTWITQDGNMPVASISLINNGDNRLWTPTELEEPALYASSLLVTPEYKARQIGAKLLNWSAEKARNEDKKWVRLDCWTTNSKLHDYYKEQGFSHVRTVTSLKSGALFQRNVA